MKTAAATQTPAPPAPSGEWTGRVILLDLEAGLPALRRELAKRYPSSARSFEVKLEGFLGPGWVLSKEHVVAKLVHSTERRPRYIVGPAHRLTVAYEPPNFSVDRWSFLGVSGYCFDAKRGRIEEWHDRDAGRHVYARELPAEAEDGLNAVDREIEQAEAALSKLRAERQDLLLSAAQRGERVKVTAIKKGGAR